MIATEFMDSFVPVDMEAALNDYNSFMESCDNEINNMFAEFNMMHEKVMLESEIMDSVPEDMMMVYEAEKSNIFTKIGEKIIAIFKKLAELIDKGIEKIKELSFKGKTDMQKLNLLIKKNPSLKDKIIGSYETGDLDMKDLQNLKELEDTFAEIMKLSKKADADPKSLSAKWEKAKEKYEKTEEAISKRADSVKKVLTVGTTIALLGASMAKAKKDLAEHKTRIKEYEAEALEYMDSRNKSNVGIAELRFRMSKFINREIITSVSDKMGIFDSILLKLAKLHDNVFDKDHKQASRYGANVQLNAKQIKAKKLSDRDEEINTAVLKQTALNDAKNN